MKRIIESAEFSNLNVYGELPHNDEAEREQIKRVLRILDDHHDKIGPWNLVFVNIEYKHTKGSLNEGDQDWKGQYDLILLSKNKIVIYELKGFQTHLIEATTSHKKWIMKNTNQDRVVKRDSYFTQASKQKTSFFKDVMEQMPFNGENHWIIDSRLVFKNGSCLDNFFYYPTATIYESSFRTEYLSNVSNDDDKELLEDYYSRIEKDTSKKKLRALRPNEEKKLKRIFKENQLNIRTAKWFRILTEDKIVNDLSVSGSYKFDLNIKEGREVGRRLLGCE